MQSRGHISETFHQALDFSAGKIGCGREETLLHEGMCYGFFVGFGR